MIEVKSNASMEHGELDNALFRLRILCLGVEFLEALAGNSSSVDLREVAVEGGPPNSVPAPLLLIALR